MLKQVQHDEEETVALAPQGRYVAGVALRLVGVMARVAGWRPEDLWSATPADVAAVLAAWAPEAEAGGVDRGSLTAMMEQCPDG